MVAVATKTAVLAVLEADSGATPEEKAAIAEVLEQGRKAKISRTAAIALLGTTARTFSRKVLETGEWPLAIDYETDISSFCYLAQVLALRSGEPVPTVKELGVSPRAKPATMRVDKARRQRADRREVPA